MAELYLILLIGGLTVLLLSPLTDIIQSKLLFLSEPLAATLIGFALSFWLSFEILDLTILKHLAHFTLVLSVMGIGLRLSRDFLKTHLSSVSLVLILGMLLMWGLSGLIVWLLFPLPAWLCFLIGAIITPTDPVLAETVVRGQEAKENIPPRVRNLLSSESAANDGLALPLVSLGLIAVSAGLGWEKWFLETWTLGIVGGVLGGLVIGFLTGALQKLLEKNQEFEKLPVLTLSVAMSVVVFAGFNWLGFSSVLGAFLAGLAFNFATQGGEPEQQQAQVQQSTANLFNFPTFLLFGYLLPWAEIFEQSWWLIGLLPILVLLLRRIPAIWLLQKWLKPLQDKSSVWLYGWFGPIGVAAIYYGLHTLDKTHEPVVWTLVSLVVFSSIFIHGVTSTPLTKVYGKIRGAQKL